MCVVTGGSSAAEWALLPLGREATVGLRMENPNVSNTLLLGTFEVCLSEIDGAGEESDVCGSRGDLEPPSSSGVTEL